MDEPQTVRGQSGRDTAWAGASLVAALLASTYCLGPTVACQRRTGRRAGRRYPRLLMSSQVVRCPLALCRGTKPSQIACSRPLRKRYAWHGDVTTHLSNQKRPLPSPISTTKRSIAVITHTLSSVTAWKEELPYLLPGTVLLWLRGHDDILFCTFHDRDQFLLLLGGNLERVERRLEFCQHDLPLCFRDLQVDMRVLHSESSILTRPAGSLAHLVRDAELEIRVW